MGQSASNGLPVRDDRLPVPLRNGVWPQVVMKLRLAPQQARIVELVMHGDGPKQIAHKLDLGLPTVRTYLDRTCKRVGAEGRVQLVVRVLEAAHDIVLRGQGPPNK